MYAESTSGRITLMLKSRPIRMLAQTLSASRRVSGRRHAEKSGRAAIGARSEPRALEESPRDASNRHAEGSPEPRVVHDPHIPVEVLQDEIAERARVALGNPAPDPGGELGVHVAEDVELHGDAGVGAGVPQALEEARQRSLRRGIGDVLPAAPGGGNAAEAHDGGPR